MNSVRKNPLRTCPKCGRRFLTRNLWHSCGRYRLADPFAGKPRVLRRTFNRFASLARACGPVDIYAQKTRIVIQARVRFAGAVGRRDWLDAGVWLKRRACHPRLHRVESFGHLGYGLHFLLQKPKTSTRPWRDSSRRRITSSGSKRQRSDGARPPDAWSTCGIWPPYTCPDPSATPRPAGS